MMWGRERQLELRAWMISEACFIRGGELFPSLELETFSAIAATFSDEASFGKMFSVIH